MAVKVQGTTIINDQTSYVDLNGTSAAKFPVGTDAQRPTGVTGRIRYNTTSCYFEGYYGTTWYPLGSILASTYCQGLLKRQLFTWGDGGRGQLGTGTTVASCSPIREFYSATDWCQLSMGNDVGAAVKTSGQMWTWGYNLVGRVGDGTATNRCSPVREFCSATDWRLVSGSFYNNGHFLAIKTDGSLWAWGINGSGRLGDGTATNRCSPVREICSATDWCQASAGNSHSLAVKTTGQVWSWGIGTCGALGVGTTVATCSAVRERCSATNWCRVSGGCLVSAAIKTDGSLWSWGAGAGGTLGDGTTVNKCSPVRERSSSTNWCHLDSGSAFASAIKTDGSIWSWGNASACGNLGDGTTVSKCSPVRERCSATNWCDLDLSILTTVAVKTDGSLWAWGRGACGQLADGTVTASRCSPVREITSSTNWFQASVGGTSGAALKLTL